MIPRPSVLQNATSAGMVPPKGGDQPWLHCTFATSQTICTNASARRAASRHRSLSAEMHRPAGGRTWSARDRAAKMTEDARAPSGQSRSRLPPCPRATPPTSFARTEVRSSRVDERLRARRERRAWALSSMSRGVLAPSDSWHSHALRPSPGRGAPGSSTWSVRAAW